MGGDCKSDFTFTSKPATGVDAKSRYATLDKVRWSVSSEEVEKKPLLFVS
jgi:hypothetical protein